MKQLRDSDEKYLERTLLLAGKGRGNTFPNPLVGCVIVKNNKIIGEGYHHKIGDNHAEINAIRTATQSLNGATLYVNLEPCSHFGKTPPCIDTIIASGIIRVVCCTLDPNILVHGKGILALKNAGIEVSVGQLQKEAQKMNESFFMFHKLHRPFVAIKYASSLDGKIATSTGESKWITNKEAREYSRKLRSQYQSILVGSQTVIKDNPHLGCRQKGLPDPLRIILDGSLKTDPKSTVYRDSNVIVFAAQKASNKRRLLFGSHNIDVYFSHQENISIEEVLKELYAKNIISVFVEGGSSILGSFNDANLIDKVYAFISARIIGGVESLSPIGGKGILSLEHSSKLERMEFTHFNDTVLVSGRLYPKTVPLT